MTSYGQRSPVHLGHSSLDRGPFSSVGMALCGIYSGPPSAVQTNGGRRRRSLTLLSDFCCHSNKVRAAAGPICLICGKTAAATAWFFNNQTTHSRPSGHLFRPIVSRSTIFPAWHRHLNGNRLARGNSFLLRQQTQNGGTLSAQ